jgi:hypothetical protein
MTIYENLKPELQLELDSSSVKYSTAMRLKYVLLSKSYWSDLTVDNVKDLITYTGQSGVQVSAFGFMYGDSFLKS